MNIYILKNTIASWNDIKALVIAAPSQEEALIISKGMSHIDSTMMEEEGFFNEKEMLNLEVSLIGTAIDGLSGILLVSEVGS